MGKIKRYAIPPRTKNFTIAIRQSGPAALVDVSGSLTSSNRVPCGCYLRIDRQETQRHHFEFRRLEYLDSSGIGELVRNYLTVIKSGGTMKVVGLSAKWKRS